MDDYSEFVKESLKEADRRRNQEAMRKIKAGITDVSEGHYHTVEMDENWQWCNNIRIAYG